MKKKKTAVAVFFLFLFLTGLLVSGDYGIPYDERTEQYILDANTREVMLRLGLERYIPPFVGRPEREYRISTSVEMDHGIASYYPISWYILHYADHPSKEVSYVWQTYTYCLNFLGVLAVFGIVKALTKNDLAACIAALILFLCPRMFAEMHYNNKDMVCMALTLVMLFFGIRWTQSRKYRFAVLFGIAAGYAINSRLASVVLYGLIGLNVVILLFIKNWRATTDKEKASVKKLWLSGWLAIAVTAVAYFIITPAMWSGPIRFVRYLAFYTLNFTRWDNSVLFAGEIFRKGAGVPLPRMYLPTYISLTTPVWVLGLIVFGLLVVWYRAVRERRYEVNIVTAYMVSLCALVPLAIAVVMRTHVYNGWRQFYFVFGPMVVLAGIAVDAIMKVLCKKPVLIGTGAVALAGCVLFTGYGLFKNHPYQYTYMNCFAGEDAENRYELDYWLVSVGPLIENVLKTEDSGKTITISYLNREEFHGLTNAVKRLTTEEKDCIRVTDDGLSAEYILVNLTYRYRISEEKLERLEREFHPWVKAEAYGNTIMVLYERSDR